MRRLLELIRKDPRAFGEWILLAGLVALFFLLWRYQPKPLTPAQQQRLEENLVKQDRGGY